MVTRGKVGIFKPKAMVAEMEPTTVREAFQSPQWVQAMHEELNALVKNQTWDLVPLPPHRKPVGSKWIFRLKHNPDGSISKYKARVVARGYTQQHGLDYQETFSPVVKHVTIRVILSIALSKGWSIRQVDINNAFLNGTLQEVVYMKPPEGFHTSNPNLVCRLKKALYGLKQAPRAWFGKLASTLVSFGFVSAKCDH
uniref:Retrovirus-related Pol polyprotein from transposon TNT 1-94 n=1 Tax=Cajanus cajan TaxID=3821 RepID=A0A151THY7_CAJCA|nr:Retrovirus-related Pol polyprotein from transposon TNT 1-94 [Cajanus cajan]